MSCRAIIGSVCAFAVLCGCTRALAQPAPKKPSPIGTWEIQGLDTDKTTWTGTLIVTAGDKDTITATIDWTAKGGKRDGASGREILSVTYFPANRYLKMNGEKLERAEGMALGAYGVTLSEDGCRLEKGKWATFGLPGTWDGKRKAIDAAKP